MAVGGFLDRLASAVLHWPRTIIAGWLVLAAACGIFAPKLLDHCAFGFDPVEGTPSGDALDRFSHDFPNVVHQDVEMVLISCEKCEICNGTIEGSTFALHAVQQLRQKCASLNETHYDIFLNWTDQFEFAGSVEGRMIGKLGMSSPYISLTNKTMLFQISWKVSLKKQTEVVNMLNEITKMVKDLDRRGANEPEQVALSVTGSLALFYSTLDSTKDDFTEKIPYVLPFALLVFTWRVQSWRLLVLPPLCLICALSIGFGVFLPYAIYVAEISPLAPSVMAFVCVALAVDYSLFMLTRYMEEVKGGATMENAVRSMLCESGHVVLISSSVLFICWLGVVAYPTSGVSTLGLAGALAALLCSATNLTLTPAMLVAFQRCFGVEAFRTEVSGGWAHRCSCFHRTRRLRAMSKGFWPKLANIVTRPPGVVVVPLICLALLIPACAELGAFKQSYAFTLTFPRRTDPSLAYKRLTTEFTPGQMNPHWLLLPAKNNNTIATADYFVQSCTYAQNLLNALSRPPFNLEPKHFQGITVLPNPADPKKLRCLTWSEAQLLLSGMAGDQGELYKNLWRQFVGLNDRSAVMLITLPFDPFGDLLQPFVETARRSMSDTSQALGGQEAYMHGTLTTIYDVVDTTYSRMPYVIGGTIVLVFAAVALAFRAALAPFKMLLTVLMPLAAVYGVSVAVYQKDVLDWLSVAQLTSPPGDGFYWATPVFTATIVIGLALDYDIFLFARVVELRRLGFANDDAVRGALCVTGPVITSAGLVMAIAFAGMMLNDVPCNNQIGFVMVFGVLVDTFIVRTFLVPSVLKLLATMNYWPQTLPPVSKGDADLKELLDKNDCQPAEGRREQPLIAAA